MSSGALTEQPVEHTLIRPDHRIPALDGLRAIASISVVLFHFGPRIAEEDSAFRWLHYLPDTLWVGVDLFFVLSGFLIASILLASRDSPRYFQTFYARRALRIFPLYYLVLAAYLVTIAALGSRTAQLGNLFEKPIHPLWYLFYLQNFAMAATGSFGPLWLAGSWSLAIEEQFYMTLPLAIRKVSSRMMCWFALSGYFGAPLIRAAIFKFRFLPNMSAAFLLPARVDSLAAGVLVALLVRYRYDLIRGREVLIRRSTIAFAAMLILYRYIPYKYNPYSVKTQFMAGWCWATLFAGILISVLVSPNASISRFLSLSWMRELGNMAYSTYLFHPILLCLAFRLLRGYDPKLASAIDLVPISVALVASLLASWLSWHFFERKILAVGQRFRY